MDWIIDHLKINFNSEEPEKQKKVPLLFYEIDFFPLSKNIISYTREESY